jgi:hypothetical protein
MRCDSFAAVAGGRNREAGGMRRSQKGEGRREKGEGRREKGEGRREKGEGDELKGQRITRGVSKSGNRREAAPAQMFRGG